MDINKAIAVILAIPLTILIVWLVYVNFQFADDIEFLKFKGNLTVSELEFLNKRIDNQRNYFSGLHEDLVADISETEDQIVSLKNAVSEKNRQIVSLTETIKSSKQPFEQAAEAIAGANEYDIDNYNCVNFSDDLIGVLETMGYSGVQKLIKQVDCFAGIFNEESCSAYDGWHEFVMVPIYIEATTGTVIEPEDYWVYDI